MDLHFYSAFPVYWTHKALYNTCQIHLFTNTFIHWWQRLPCKVSTAHQEQFGVQYLVQGHFGMLLGGARICTSNLPITKRPTVPPEPQLPDFHFSRKVEEIPLKNEVTLDNGQYYWTKEGISSDIDKKVKWHCCVIKVPCISIPNLLFIMELHYLAWS